MSALQHLATQALLGTDQRSPVWAVDDSPVGQVVQALAAATESDPARQLLRAAGVLTLCADAGYQPGPLDAEGAPPCPPESSAVLQEAKAISLLQQIFADGPQRLQQQALAVLAARQLLLPPRLLPQLLELGRQSPAVRAALDGVLGQRGRWLAAYNPSWAIFSTAITTDGSAGRLDADLWEHGSLEQRKAYLAQLRGQDVAQARSLLAQSLGSLDARERAALLEVLEPGLCAEDEDLLESLLQDRSKEVRQTAAALLAQLPNSRYVQRMTERLAACLRRPSAPPPSSWGASVLKRLSTRSQAQPALVIEPPESFDADWKRDALEEKKPPGEGLGPRAWWLYQMACQVPLSWWQLQTGLSPAELLTWAGKTDWADALLRAWLQVLQRERHATWAQAVLDTLPADGGDVSVAQTHVNGFTLAWLLPLEQREPYWLQCLDAGRGKDRSLSLGRLLARICDALPANYPGFSVLMSRQLIQHLHSWVQQEHASYDYELRRVMPDLACLLPTECLSEALQDWPTDKDAAPCCAEALTRLSATLAQRRQLHQFFA